MQPTHRPAGGELELGLALGLGGELVDRGEQHLLHGPLQGPHREALLDGAVGGLLVEALEGGAQAVAAGGRLLALAGQLDRRGDVAGRGERVAQRLQLDQLVVAVVAGGALGHREAVAALPASQRVGADAENFGGGVGPDSRHAQHSGTGLAGLHQLWTDFRNLSAILQRLLERADADRLADRAGAPHRLVGLVEEPIGFVAVLRAGDDAGRYPDPQAARPLEVVEPDAAGARPSARRRPCPGREPARRGRPPRAGRSRRRGGRCRPAPRRRRPGPSRGRHPRRRRAPPGPRRRRQRGRRAARSGAGTRATGRAGGASGRVGRGSGAAPSPAAAPGEPSSCCPERADGGRGDRAELLGELLGGGGEQCRVAAGHLLMQLAQQRGLQDGHLAGELAGAGAGARTRVVSVSRWPRRDLGDSTGRQPAKNPQFAA